MTTSMHHPLSQIDIMNRLKGVGFTQEQSETQAQILTEVNEYNHATKQDLKDLEQGFKNLEQATKRDLKDLEKTTEIEFALVRKDIDNLDKAMGNGFALVRMEFKKDMETLKFDLTTRMGIIVTSGLAILTAIQKFVLN